MKVIVLLNKHSGTQSADEESQRLTIEAAFTAAGIDADVRYVPGDQLAAEARSSTQAGIDAVIAGGGDGTVSAVAGALVGDDTPLGVLPLGTLNHFAKDLGVPFNVVAAVAIIAQRNVQSIDVAQVNDRVFINNSSLGVYARALIDRDLRRERHGWRKWRAMASAALKIFRRSPMLRVRLTAPGDVRILKTPLVFIGNNRYRLELPNVGQRDRLDEGLLSLYVATTHTRWGMFKIIVRAMLGRLEQSRDFEALLVDTVTIDSRRSQLPVAIDGEITRLAPPLVYRTLPGALKLLAPISSPSLEGRG
jgi:diacylglycerol kinase family enzyme